MLHDPDTVDDESHPRPGGTGVQLKAGVEAGWQFTAGPLYAGVSAGVSGGACFNCAKGALIGQMLGPENSGASRTERASVAPAVDFQIDLLRLGVAF